jgi:hypothetical protein
VFERRQISVWHIPSYLHTTLANTLEAFIHNVDPHTAPWKQVRIAILLINNLCTTPAAPDDTTATVPLHRIPSPHVSYFSRNISTTTSSKSQMKDDERLGA